MKFKITLFALMALLIACQGESQNRISINIPTVDSETEYIWRTIQDIKFFEENNYNVNLPQGQLIQELIDKSQLESLIDEDYGRLKMYVQDSVYNKLDYQKGYEKIVNERALINNMISEISKSDYKWNFKEFDIYQINLTLYGPGGSYDPDEGSVLIYTTTGGQFKNYDNPANTVIHEITHIGIEESIIGKYQVPHALKERIVDSFVFLHFNNYLPNYRIQDMGEKRIDRYLKSKIDLKDLGNFVEEIMKAN